MNDSLSELTEKFLLESGWYQDRKINIEHHLSALHQDGYRTNDVVIAFLHEFSDLKVTIPSTNPQKTDDYFEINPTQGVAGVYISSVRDYEFRTHEELVVVGEAYKRHMVLMLSWTGKLYGGYADFLVCFGETPQEGLNKLCEGKKVEEIA